MAADGESTGKSKGRKDRADEADIDESVEKDGRLDVNELETIPTMVPREGDGYQVRAVDRSDRGRDASANRATP